MTSTTVLLVFSTLLVGSAIGLGCGLVMARQARRRAGDDQQRLVQAVQAAVADRSESVLRSAVDTAAAVAGEKLGDHLAIGSQEVTLRSEAMQQQIAGIDGRLAQFSTVVADLQRETGERHAQLVTRLEHATTASTELADTTRHLREALASPKARGQWGERMADDVLRLAGLVEGVNYRKQTGIAGGGIPDVTFFMPKDLLLHMDVKFPADNYLRSIEAETEHERAQFTRAFTKDVRARVKEIAARDYVDPERTVGYVLLFIPNESIYSFIHDHDRTLLDDAMRSQVVMCSPSTLFAVLAVVRQAMDNFLLERASEEILQCLEGFDREWRKFAHQVDKVGRAFDSVHKNFDDLAGTRRRVLQDQLDRIDDLRRRKGLAADEAAEAATDRLAADDDLSADDRAPVLDAEPPAPVPFLRRVGTG